MSRKVSRRIQRGVFGRDPAGYDRSRLSYPKRVFEILTKRCGLHPGSAVFEIGPGTGIATRELLRRGANPLTLIERDRRLVRFLGHSLRASEDRVKFIVQAFETAALPTAGFDLGTAATSFHWLPQRLALRKVARVLKPGGWWATWNNHHGDPTRASPFHEALQPIYQKLSRRPVGWSHVMAAARKDRRNRLRALESVRRFDQIAREDIRWSVSLNARQVQRLWGTFSEIVTLSPKNRDWFLAELGKTVEEQFEGRVSIPMLTPIYTARKT